MNHHSALILALALLSACQADRPPSPAAAATSPAVTVETARVTERALTETIRAVGTLQSLESTTITSELSGRIAEVHFAEGDALSAGALLFRLDDQIDRAELAQAEASLRLAERNHLRAQELAQRRLVSPAEVDQTEAALAVAKAASDLMKARVAKHRITAPFNGVAGLRQVSPGAYVNPGEPLVQFEALDPMRVEFRVPETVLGDLRIGQTVAVHLDAFPGASFPATVQALAARVSESSRSVAVRARIDQPDPRLRPGLFARVELDLATREGALLVPEAAVFPRGESARVFRVIDGRAAETEIQLGQRMPGMVEVTAGLQADDVVIVSGLQRLSDGSTVQRNR